MQRAPVNPVAVDINQQAGRLVQSGQLDAAAQVLERGLRIVPKDASLWSHLATVRLQQKHYGQARSLAAKSNSLAGGNTTVIRNNQRIMDAAQRGEQQ
jgi:predicted Zn-dependent protease